MLDELADPPAIASAAYHAAIRARAVHAGEPEEALAASRAAVDAYLAAGDIRGAAFALGNAGWSYMILGALAESAEASSESLRLQGSAGGSDESTLANLGLVLARLGRSGEAARRLRAQIDALSHDAAAVATLQQALAFVQARGDSLAEAEELARAAAAAQESLAPACAEALVVLAEILFSAGRPAEALDGVERAYTLVDPLLEHDGLGRLVRVEALLALGRDREADEVLFAARERILARAGRIADAALRAGFLENLEEHRRTLELAAQRGMQAEVELPARRQ
jgi:predicted O-linked N-acetylglucosamine transferase (SPINDLY family)